MDDFSDFTSDSIHSSITGKPTRGTRIQMGNMAPNNSGTSTEAQVLKPLAASSAAEKVASDEFESGFKNLSVLRTAIAEQKDPALKKILSDHYNQLANNKPADDFADFNSASIHEDVKKLPVDKSTPANAEAIGIKDTRPLTGNKGKNQTIASPGFDFIANQASSVGSTIAGGYAGMYKGLKTLLQTGDKDKALAEAVSAIEKTREQGTFEPKTQVGQQMVDGFSSKYNPLQWPVMAAQAVGDASGDALANNGMPAAGAVAKGVGAAAPLALGFKGVQGGFRNLNDLMRPQSPPELAPVSAKPAYKLVNGKPELINDSIQVPSITPPITSSQNLPFKPVPNTEGAIRYAAQNAPHQLFPDTPTTAPAGTLFSAADQLARAKVLESIGIDPNKIRKSAISGDGVGGSTDYQTTKLDSAAGRQMRAVLDQEKSAIIDHSQSLVADTGGTTGMDKSTLVTRGNTIIAPIDALGKYLDKKTSDSYKAADAIGKGVPTKLDGFVDTLNDKSHMLTRESGLLKDAVNAHADRLGMLNEDGSISGTALQSEKLRQFIGSAYSYENGKFNIKLKEAMDEDVMHAAGGKVYEDSRDLHTYRKNTLDNPDGIANISDSSGPGGINRKVAIEKIPDHLAGLPVAQFTHIVRTLKEMPPELQDSATASLSEIKGHFVNRLHVVGTSQAGQWNAKGVTKYLKDNSVYMAEVFTPEQMAKFRNLNDAGHILAKDQSYPGAAIQGHNLMTHGVMLGLQGGGAAAGGFVGGPVGAAAGGYAGRIAASAVGEAASVRAVNKRMVKMSDLLETK